jgi:hypothetical protein
MKRLTSCKTLGLTVFVLEQWDGHADGCGVPDDGSDQRPNLLS